MDTDHLAESFTNSVYQVKSGKAIIFNHDVFTHKLLPRRIGTEKDVDKLKKTLENFNFQVEIREDQNVTQIKSYLETFSANRHDNVDAVLVAVLTHGDEDGLYDVKGTLYDPREILCNPFTSENLTLSGKPKIFLISACRGNKADYGQVTELQGPPGGAGPARARQVPLYVKIPSESEFLVYKSTPQGYVSYRNKELGTRFIQVLCQVLDHHHQAGHQEPCDLLSLLTLVNRKVAQMDIMTKSGKEMKQVPEIQSTLTKLIYLTHRHNS